MAEEGIWSRIAAHETTFKLNGDGLKGYGMRGNKGSLTQVNKGKVNELYLGSLKNH